MSTTLTGRLLLPQNFAVPRLHDIAVQSGRIVRFSGAAHMPPSPIHGTPRMYPAHGHWSVLHHLRVCHDLLHALVPDFPLLLMLRLLLHDSDEVATSDVPTLWKAPEQRLLGVGLQGRIYLTYSGQPCTPEEYRAVKRLDLLSLRAEMEVVGPPGILHHSGFESYPFDNDEVETAVAIVRATVAVAPNPLSCCDLHAPLVRWYLRALNGAGVRNPWGEDLLLPDEEPWQQATISAG
jgi:hypothetical protein